MSKKSNVESAKTIGDYYYDHRFALFDSFDLIGTFYAKRQSAFVPPKTYIKNNTSSTVATNVVQYVVLTTHVHASHDSTVQ